jgi:hypothetical protein
MVQDYPTEEELVLKFKFAFAKEATAVLNNLFCYTASYLRRE